MKNLLKYLKNSLLIILITLIALEVILQLSVWYKNTPNSMIDYMRLRSGERTGLYGPDPYSLYKHVAGSHIIASKRIELNKDGFRSKIDSDLKKEANEIRILLVGGSTTYGIALNNEEAWGNQLEKYLTKKNPHKKITVINAGVGGYTTAESIGALAFRGINYQPDYILIHHVYNDINPRTTKDNFKHDYSHYRPPQWRTDDRPAILRLSMIYNIIMVKFLDARYHSTVYWMTMRDFDGKTFYDRDANMEKRLERLAKTNNETFTRNLKTLIGISNIFNARPVLITGPLSKPASWPSLTKGVAQANDSIRKLSKEESIDIIDLALTFPTSDISNFNKPKDPMHVSPAGAIVKASLIGEGLQKLIDGN